jgi:hypothetical protein
MKKIFSLIFLLCISTLTFASPQMKITKQWHLNPWHDFVYYIENPTHANLEFEIEMAPTTVDYYGNSVPSAPIKLTCGGQEFYIASYDTIDMTVCKSTPNFPYIKIELVHLDGNPSEGKFTLQFK